MRKVIVFLAAVLTLSLSLVFLFTQTENKTSASTEDKAFFASLKPASVQAEKFAVTPPLKDLALKVQQTQPAKKFSLTEVRPEIEKEVLSFEKPGAVHDADTSIALSSGISMPAPLLSFDGMNNIDNGLNHGLLVLPPDMNGDVGPNHYVQSMNILFRVFDKSGNALTPPLKMSSLFASLGTLCSTRDDGEPTVVYDPLADRWIMSQYCNLQVPFRQMVAISKTGDPTGSYYAYEFVMPNFKQNDVSKFGVWPNAYYMATEQFLGSDFAGTGAFAFDRAKLLRGDPTASFIYFDIPSTVGITRLGNLLPADLDGLTPPPANVSGLFMSYMATEYGAAQDALRIFELKPDFGRPLESTFSELPTSPVAVAAFDPTSPPDRNDIFQPPPGEMLDANSDRLMYRLSYRNFGDRESLVVNQTVRTTPLTQQYHAGIRLWELSRSGTTAPFVPNVQSTISGPGENRWIGSAAQDHQGNVAVAYNSGNDLKKPSIFYSGRAATDPPGTLRDEMSLVEATGVQTAFGFRWGDYSNTVVDPADDCTFWTIGQYYTQASQDQSPFGWITRIGAFRFPECTNAPRANIQGQVTNAVTGQPLQNVLLEANTAFTRSTSAQGNYTAMLIPGSYSVKASAHGYIPQTVTINLANGATVTQNFALQPRAVLEAASTGLSAESCGLNSVAEPGETVTLTLPLKNTGAADLNDVTVTLQAGGGVLNPSAPQNYGSLPAGGATVVRSFTFTVSPNIPCGANLALSFGFQTPNSAGSFLFSLNTGVLHFTLQESFNRASPGLPPGWSTAISGEVDPWQKVLVEPTQNDYAAFSPESIRVGVSELVSPAINVTGSNAVLYFRNKYDLESTFLRNRLYDGGVLEMKIGNSAFQDITTAGGQFASGGYVGMIDGCCQNPLAGRQGWSARSGVNQEAEWISTKVLLPPSAAGQPVQFRWRLGTDIGGRRTGQWIDNVELQDGVSCSCQNVAPLYPQFDFDGDGKTDFSTYNPSDNAANSDFSYQRSSNGSTQGISWGSVGDLPAVADYDGDGKADAAVFRPSNGAWYILRSSNATVSIASFGLAGDKTVPDDFDGDGKDDISIFRPSTGVWYVMKSSDGQFIINQFGLNGDVPVQGDYDGDGLADIAVWRPGNGVWYVVRSSQGIYIAPFGTNGDIPVPGDHDGDGKNDLVVFRPSNASWYVNGTTAGFTVVQFGLSTDKPLQGDFDGDGKEDIAVYRPATNTWFYLRSSNGSFAAGQFGGAGDTPVPAIYLP